MTQPDRFIRVPESIAAEIFQNFHTQLEVFKKESKSLRLLGAKVLVHDQFGPARAVGLHLNPGVLIPEGFKPQPLWGEGEVLPDRRTRLGKAYQRQLESLKPPSIKAELNKRNYPTYHWISSSHLQQLECPMLEAENLILIRIPAGCESAPGEALTYEAYYALIAQHAAVKERFLPHWNGSPLVPAL